MVQLEDARLGNNSLYRDTVLWMHGGDPNIKGDELTVGEQFRSLVNSGALDWFIRERTPERFQVRNCRASISLRRSSTRT